MWKSYPVQFNSVDFPEETTQKSIDGQITRTKNQDEQGGKPIVIGRRRCELIRIAEDRRKGLRFSRQICHGHVDKKQQGYQPGSDAEREERASHKLQQRYPDR